MESIEKRHIRRVDLRTGTENIRRDYDAYLKDVDEMLEIMRERYIFKKPIYVNRKSIINGKSIESAEVTQDGRLLIKEYRRFFRRFTVDREYHLRDLSEMLGLFGKEVSNLSQVSEDDIGRLRNILARDRFY